MQFILVTVQESGRHGIRNVGMRPASVHRPRGWFILSRYGQLYAPISKRKYRASGTPVNVFLDEISCNLPASTLLANATWPDCLLDIHKLQELVLQVSNVAICYSLQLITWKYCLPVIFSFIFTSLLNSNKIRMLRLKSWSFLEWLSLVF